ncbi:peroxiredoxin-6 [Toxorhynchites rutilus septentrionalis]|uniref:peroxiredoxin-6 n=1 Tax=Toxorhynchites rutilus septentrionalis TaxID=329112 RepID=UPI00247A0042|nr:peroxiredoxin-6 [Toxorhynchites rutilus septentrionalis]
MVLNLGDQFPNFIADTTDGKIDFHEWAGDSWAILFSHPADFTPVCTTELSAVARLIPEFTKRNVKPIALSCDSVDSHNGWIDDIKAYGKLSEFGYPIIDDAKRELAVKLNMLDKDEIGAGGLPLTCRAVFVIDPNRKLRLSILYPATTGRNFAEILRTIDAMQLTDKKRVATPADWVQGQECMVQPSVKEEELAELFPDGVTNVDLPSGKKYLRKTAP